MLRVRPINASDKDALFDLAKQAGPGFTSLSVGEDALAARLEKSVKSFARSGEESDSDVYLLILEDVERGEVAGLSAVKTDIGLQDPFFNYRILKIAQKSAVADKRFDMDVLVLVNEYAGATEVGSLYIRPEARGSGAGRLISQARYMLMAANAARFGDRLVSELRGRVDENGFAPFWEAIGRKFFQMDFNEADHISAGKDNQFILDLMPTYPIYADLLPEAAREVIGKTHPKGEGARRYLEEEGFRYNGVIDIFDGGPSVSVLKSDLRTLRDSRHYMVEAGAGELPLTALVSNDHLAEFRCVLCPARIDNETLFLDAAYIHALGINNGDTVRAWIK